MEHTNIGFVNLNDQYNMNSAKSKPGAATVQIDGNSIVMRSTANKFRSNSQGSNDK